MKKATWYLSLILVLALTLTGAPLALTEGAAQEDAAPYAETLTLTVGALEAAGWSVDSPDVMQQFVEDKFNVKFVPVNVGWGDYADKMGVAAASGDLPDMFFHGIRGTQTYYDWIAQGVVQPWKVDPERHPLTYATVHAPHIEGLWTDDQTYFLPKFSYMEPSWWSMDKALFVRKDWMESLGIEDPASDAEFLAMCEAFRNGDPDGNGVKDTFGIAPRIWDSLFYFEYGAYPDGVFGSRVWDEATGQYTLNLLTERGFAALKAFRAMYQADVLDPDFPTYKGDDALNAFVSGRVGVLAHSAPPDHIRALFDLWIGVNADKDFFDTVKVLYPWPNKNGEMYYNMSVEFGETYLNSEVSQEKADRYLDIHEWMLSDEGILFTALGLEGVSYEVNPDGSYASLLGTRETGDPVRPMDVYPSLKAFNAFACYSGAHAQFFNPENPKEMVKMSEDYRDYMLKNGKVDQIDYDIRLINAPKLNMLGLDVHAEVLEFVMAPESMSDEEAYQALKQKLDGLGLTDALKELNELAAAAGLPK